MGLIIAIGGGLVAAIITSMALMAGLLYKASQEHAELFEG